MLDLKGPIFELSVFLIQLYTCLAITPDITPRPSRAPITVTIVVYGRVTEQGVTSLSIAEPPYELAVEKIRRDYGEYFTFDYVRTTASPCLFDLQPDAQNANDSLPWWYNRLFEPDRVLVFLTPGGSGLICDANDASMQSLAGNWNTIIFNTISGIEMKGRSAPFATSLSFTSVGGTKYIDLALTLIVYYQWKSVFIVWDESSAPAFRALANGLSTGLNRIGKGYFHKKRHIKSHSSFIYQPTLWEFGNVSRIMFYYGHAVWLRRILITAASLNMTDGQFVYIFTEMMSAPTLYGNLTWYNGDEDDEVARRAFQSLLILQPLDPPSQMSEQQPGQTGILAEFRRRSMLKYNASYAPGYDLINVLEDGYIAVLLLGQVLNETREDGQDLTDGRGLADRFLNRTFPTADFGDVFIDENGMRCNDYAVVHYNAIGESRQPFLVQYASTVNSLSPINGPIQWPGGDWPPLSQPRCGLLADACQEKRSVTSLAGVVIGSFSVMGVFAAVVVRVVRLNWSDSTLWWFIQHRELQNKTEDRKSVLPFSELLALAERLFNLPVASNLLIKWPTPY
ncbi:hypothetical protein BV898_06960 [Hypsibius exemplaris]|uniref:Receptor ligand binding region domain-containing protein n=1 Tax=Hypsibius exemplaris TaxID=2072580 RepID=A0A1W0WUK6_HYPEX|nr:hypothetical protein BV898_06960 [Hypsibius exemplaris]